ncbi:MAG: hypothetical protein ACRELS_21130 [Candidatus Rokuibacteriota bacterium]
MCDQASTCCPLFLGPATRIHWSFDDPSAASGDEDERPRAFRGVLDRIAARLRSWLAGNMPGLP